MEYSVGDSMNLKQLITAIAPFKVFSNAFSPVAFEILDSLCFYDSDAIVYTEAQLKKYFKKDIKFVNGSYANIKLNKEALEEWYEVFVQLCTNSILLQPQHDISKVVSSQAFALWYEKANSAHRRKRGKELQELRNELPLPVESDTVASIIRSVMLSLIHI